ncbi:MAG: site-specific DNA-methyltransferase [Thaumarchaeota archaeon]|nr:site-specific DNA-methyltransferase [Nitrososphaerota archaeon]
MAKRPVRGARQGAVIEDLLTLGDAAALVGKTTSNISYLVQYDRLRKFDTSGNVVARAPNGGLRVSKSELLDYVAGWNLRVRSRMEELKIVDTSIAFLDVPERERTKHVHRLHPYLGKFIPQLVGYFLSRYFEPGQTVLDPFSGSGTTLVEASERGMDSVGIEISEFNVMISRVKLADYEIPALEKEVVDVTRRTAEFSAREFPGGRRSRPLRAPVEGAGYLETWFAPRSLREMLYFRDIIPEYEHQDLLKVMLSRTARSCRLVHHYDLATPKEPVKGPYVCYKHKGKTCGPVTTILPRLRFYSIDTVRRIAEFKGARRPANSLVIEGDSREVKLEGRRVDGIFTSPPYVGQIDYHEQHRYAYELFGIERRDGFEIGPKMKGKGERARADYARSMAASLRNVSAPMPQGGVVLLVANDKLGLYPGIFEEAGMRVKRSFERPVEDRTERDKRPYSETVFLARLER